MAGSNTPPDDETSYVKMADVDRLRSAAGEDATLVGAHCQYEYCNQLDFLPFLCQSCGHTYCLDHRSESAHRCAHAGAWAQRRREAQLARPAAGEGRRVRDLVAEKPCASPACRTVVGTSLVPGVHCDGCNRDYCLKHRMREDHDCRNLAPLGARAQTLDNAAERARTALDRLKAWGSAKRQAMAAGRALPAARPSSAAARAVAVNSLKKTARGDDKLPPERRVYLYVEAEAATAAAKIPKGHFFYSKDWVVGRVLDAAARALQVQNLNNQSADERDKLRVFHVEGGRLLEYNEKVGSALVSGNTIVLLRGVGPPPDLIEP